MEAAYISPVKGGHLNAIRQWSSWTRKPLIQLEEDSNGYLELPTPRKEYLKLSSQKELVQSFMTLTYSESSILSQLHPNAGQSFPGRATQNERSVLP
jgi:hypothetical protein